MGLKPPLLRFIETSIEEALGKAKGLRMLELGDQLIPDAAIPALGELLRSAGLR